MTAKRVAIIGSGSWGTAIACLLHRNGHRAKLCARRPELAQKIAIERENDEYLPGIEIPEKIEVTSDLGEAVEGGEICFLVVPSHGMRALLMKLSKQLPEKAILVSAAKGIENGSLARMSEVVEQSFIARGKPRITVLSGPSFAREVAMGRPAAVVIASENLRDAKVVQRALSDSTFRCYTQQDLVGVEIGGALKNVIAIAAGVVDGLDLGHSTKAALITRGLAEIGRLAHALGGDRKTVSGLSGLGDLVLTCTGHLSRNRSFGERLAKGESLETLLQQKTVAEGVKTARAGLDLAKKHSVEMPIVAEVYRVLYEGKDPRRGIESLMSRTLKQE